VLQGQLRFRLGDREEVFDAGDAFYLPPGHIGIGNEPGTEFVQFSPTEELRQVSETIMKNMQAMQGGD
jgi:quercetin dioxygenase-like cupin family protein